MFKITKENLVHVFTIAYNEEKMIQFFIDHYRTRFPNCLITVYDNQSTDSTVQICEANNCKVISYDTNNKLSDSTYLQIKNNCWKTNYDFKWALICDVDELLDITQQDLIELDDRGVTLVKGYGYNMVNIHDHEVELEQIDHGFRAEAYDKIYLINTEQIDEINYYAGCHNSNPAGKIMYNLNDKKFNLYHYKFLSEDYMVERYKLFESRISDENKLYGWGVHYQTPEEQIRINFKNAKEISEKVKF